MNTVQDSARAIVGSPPCTQGDDPQAEGFPCVQSMERFTHARRRAAINGTITPGEVASAEQCSGLSACKGVPAPLHAASDERCSGHLACKGAIPPLIATESEPRSGSAVYRRAIFPLHARGQFLPSRHPSLNDAQTTSPATFTPLPCTRSMGRSTEKNELDLNRVQGALRSMGQASYCTQPILNTVHIPLHAREGSVH